MAAPKKKNTPDNPKAKPVMGRPEKYTEEWLDQEADLLRAWINNDDEKKIYIGSFARQRGYGRQRLTEFVKSSKKFSDAYDEAKLWQEEFFMRKGLTREWDPGFTARCMARVCGPEWKNSWDKEETKEAVQPVVVVNKIYKNQLEDKDTD